MTVYNSSMYIPPSPGYVSGSTRKKCFLGSPVLKRKSLTSPTTPCKVKVSSRPTFDKPSNERFLQGTDKRRRYLRRGSKTSCMLRIPSSLDLEFGLLIPNSSNHSCSSVSSSSSNNSGPWNNRSVALVNLAINEARRGMSASADVSDMAVSQEGLDQRSQKKMATMSLLTSALALSSIHDETDDEHQASTRRHTMPTATASTTVQPSVCSIWEN